MAFEDLRNSIHQLREGARAFKQSSAEYYKLRLFRDLTKGVVSFITIVVLLFLGTFALIFLSIAVAISISEALDSPSAGYFIVAGIYILLIILLLLVGKKYIERTVLIRSSRKMFNN